MGKLVSHITGPGRRTIGSAFNLASSISSAVSALYPTPFGLKKSVSVQTRLGGLEVPDCFVFGVVLTHTNRAVGPW